MKNTKKKKLKLNPRDISIVNIVASLIVVLSIGYVVVTSHQSSALNLKSNNSASSQELSKTARDYTNVLLSQVKPGSKGRDVDQIVKTAKARAEILKSLILEDPKSAENELLDPSFTQSLPEAAQPYLEQNLESEGELTVLHVDWAEEGKELKHTHYYYRIREDDGTEREVQFSSQLPENAKTGSRVKIKGRSVDSVLLAAGGSAVEVEDTTVSESPGFKNVAVLLVNFVDKTVQPFTADQVTSSYFTAARSASNFFKETSFGKTSFSGDVFGWYTINKTYKVCDYYGFRDEADAAARAAGVDLSSYTHISYVLAGPSCGWGGLGTVGGSIPRTWLNNTISAGIVAHELGHNEGNWHAASLRCGTKPIDAYSSCTPSEYGNLYDTMGAANLDHFNAYEKAMLGYIPTSSIQTVTSNGTYTLTPQEKSSTGIQLIKVPKLDTKTHYYLEYRQPYGFDSALPATITGGAGILLYDTAITYSTQASHYNSFLLDNNPSTTSWSDASLTDGQSFSDPANGLTITQNSHSSSEATFTINFSTPICLEKSPTITLTPANQTASAGKELKYTATIVNNDSYSCPSSTFNFSGGLPPGWTSTFSPSSITLAPGGSGTTSFSVTSAATAADAAYRVTAIATDTVTPLSSSSGNATYTVFTDTIAPTVTITQPLNNSTITSRKVSIAATASDNVGVSRVEFTVDGKPLSMDTSSPYTAGWNPQFVSIGKHTITATAYDGSGNSATASVVINKTK